MNESAILVAVVGFVSGAVVASLIARAQTRHALASCRGILAASWLLQIELSSFKERASWVPDLEGKLETCVQSLNGVNECNLDSGVGSAARAPRSMPLGYVRSKRWTPALA